MWRQMMLSAGIVLGFATCKSGGDTAPQPQNTNEVKVDVQATFDNTKTLVSAMNILDFTGTWCGWCPRAAVDAERIYNENPGKVTIIGIHYGDQFDDKTISTPFTNKFSVTGYPTVIGNHKDKMVNNNNFYPQFVNYRNGMSANSEVGVALDAKQDPNDARTMHTVLSFGGKPNTSYTYLVFRTESGFKADHSNYDSNLGGSKLSNFAIDHVATAVYTPSAGTNFNTNIQGVFRTPNIQVRVSGTTGITTEIVVVILRDGVFVNSRAFKITSTPEIHQGFNYTSN